MVINLNSPLNYNYYYTHGKHNFDMCQEIIKINKNVKNTNYNDWVITTAFYSGIHYIYSYCFKDKFVHNNKTYKDFDTYFRDVSDYFKGSRHRATCELASERMPDKCASFIEFLYKESRSARYNNYQVSTLIADQSFTKLLGLKVEADKKVTSQG